jgi:hypothetical protein
MGASFYFGEGASFAGGVFGIIVNIVFLAWLSLSWLVRKILESYNYQKDNSDASLHPAVSLLTLLPAISQSRLLSPDIK